MTTPPLRPAIAALLALLQPLAPVALQARAPQHQAVVRPALWKLTDKDSTLWLFGTIHALPPHFEWETPQLKAIVAQSDRLVLEAVIDRDDAASGQALIRLGVPKTPLPPILDRVQPKYRARLTEMAAKAGVPVMLLDRMKTWTAGMVLFGVTVTGLGVSGADGVEEQLKTQFRSANKPVEGLETLDQQLGFFDTLTEAQQRAFLEGIVSGDNRDAADFGQMLGAWSHGDERGIQKTFDRDMKKDGALQEVLIARRNAHWADLLVGRLAQPGTQFVAVGAGHLVGPQSVQAMLAKLGYTAERVE